MPKLKIMLKNLQDFRFRIAICFNILSAKRFLVVTSNDQNKLKTIDLQQMDISPDDEIKIANTIRSNSISCNENLQHCKYVDQILTDLIYN
jgi:hypothetical protein